MAIFKTILQHFGLTFSGEEDISFSGIYATVTREDLASGSWKEEEPGLWVEQSECEGLALCLTKYGARTYMATLNLYSYY